MKEIKRFFWSYSLQIYFIFGLFGLGAFFSYLTKEPIFLTAISLFVIWVTVIFSATYKPGR